MNPGCAPSDVIAMLALGDTGPEAQAWMAHVSQCESCAALLKDALADMDRDLTPEESELAAKIEAPAAMPGRVSGPRWPWMAVAAGVILVVAVGVALRALSPRLAPATEPYSDLLAKDFATHRSTDFRIPGSPHGRIQLQRSSTASQTPPSILVGLAEALQKKPSDPHLLHAKGRLALLEGRFDDAVAALESLRGSLPGSGDPAIGIDLALAYAQRARLTNDAGDRQMAMRLLETNLQGHPDDATAMLNLGIVLYDAGRNSEAAVWFRRYLTVEQDPAWRREGSDWLAKVADGRTP